MNRNTWIIIIVAVTVIIGLIWIFNRGPSNIGDKQPIITGQVITLNPNENLDATQQKMQYLYQYWDYCVNKYGSTFCGPIFEGKL